MYRALNQAQEKSVTEALATKLARRNN